MFAASPVGLYAAQGLNARFGIQTGNQGRMGLANAAAKNFNNPAFMGAVAQADKQLEMRNAQLSFTGMALDEMQKAARKLQKENIRNSFSTFA